MKKKYLLNLLTFMMVTIVSVGFVSCGDDDDNPNDNPNDNPVSIVGTWRCDYDDGYYLLSLKPNGQGLMQAYDLSSQSIEESEAITYYYDKEKGRYMIVFKDAENSFSCPVQYYNETTLVMLSSDEIKFFTFTRVSY